MLRPPGIDAAAERGQPAEPPAAAVVGYVFSDKKRRSLLTPEFVERARLRGLRFVAVDPLRPLEEQEGHPFDVVLHKLPSSSPHFPCWEQQLARYKRVNPCVCVVDTPQAARQLSNRATMLQALDGLELGESIGTSVAAPRQIVVEGDAAEVQERVRRSELAFPLLAKPLMADGSESSHALALLYDEAGLATLARGGVAGLLPPCVLQEFVDHGGSIFKVYVVGEVVTLARRRSLPDQRGGCAHGFEALERISTLGPLWREQAAAEPAAAASPDAPALGAVVEPGAAFVQALATALRASLGLQLFNFDLIRVAGERDRFLVVDINYFPGIAKMPGYEAVFSEFLAGLLPGRQGGSMGSCELQAREAAAAATAAPHTV